MVFMWFVSSFSKPARKVILDADLGECEIDDVTDDINALIFMGLEHGAFEASVVVPNDDSANIVSVALGFPDDNSWEEFCRAFLKENCNDSNDNVESDSENEEN